MPAKRSLGTSQSLTFIGALLVTTAFTVPAFAQIETVVVTAEKRSEDIQSVPIAVTAYTAQDLAAHQVNQFKDIQFSTPNVYYSKTNFTGTNFAIRGIGTQVISGDAESGIAFNINDIFYESAPVDSGQFYDIDRVEVLRGPQSTLYGRGATGGAVNVFSARPKLDAFAASIDASYGTYNTSEIKGMVNMPIIDGQLGVRVAADWIRHDGYDTNVDAAAGDAHPDSRDQWSARGSIRWQPTNDTTVDVIVEHGDENDTRMRGEKQLCHTDPSGVLGCLPDELANQPVNPNATFFNIPVSSQATLQVFGPVLGPAAALLGLFDLTQAYVAPPGAVPSNPRTINSDFTPTTKGRGNSITGEVKQKWADWLDMTLVGGYADGEIKSQESYTNSPGAPFDPVKLATSEFVFASTLQAYAAGGLVPPSFADPVNGPYAFILNPPTPGTLPTSNFTNNGIIGGSINRYTSNPFAYDQSNGVSKQWSADLRFNTNFDGPLNFMLAAYYLKYDAAGDYFVGANTLDYGQTLIGGILGPVLALLGEPVPGCNTTGCIFGTPYYDNNTERSNVDSKAIYGEAYWTAIPDTLKVTIGLRGTQDIKDYTGGIRIFNGFMPIGSNDATAAMQTCYGEFAAGNPQQAGCDLGAATNTPGIYQNTHRDFEQLTGRAVIDWTPKLSFTDQTLIYASYSRGYKAGGSNPGVQPGNIGVPFVYKPESIDAYEIGAKNTLLDGRLQANLTAWYYDYGNYQISSIISNTSVNTNINSFLNGFEGEFVWAPTDKWQFNLSAGWTQSKVGQTSQIDTRNPGAGLSYGLVVKDATLTTTNAQNCVLYDNAPGGTGNVSADFGTLSLFTGGLFFAPPGGINSLSGAGVPNAAYGTCSTGIYDKLVAAGLATKVAQGKYILPGGFATWDDSTGGSLTGVPVNLDGNQLADTPPYTISFGAQYTMPVGGGFNLVSRGDFYWQAASWGRIFNDSADRIKSYSVMNALFTLNAPNNEWYVALYGRNLLGGSKVTGQYLTSSSSGLWTGVFYGEPRNVGITVGARF
ncbi:MAG: TonB-dependent receptor [Alphaproteobacteria bacterium]|nr:TonB-dependent receptor [Alphaproteobacteria bacterium]MBV9693822.1 TonB-dependent receptor [Alphaproteobacteria bacterium]